VDLQEVVRHGPSNVRLVEGKHCKGFRRHGRRLGRRGPRDFGSQINTLMQTRLMSLPGIIRYSLISMQQTWRRLLLRTQSFLAVSESWTTVQSASTGHIRWRVDTVVELSLAARPYLHFGFLMWKPGDTPGSPVVPHFTTILRLYGAWPVAGGWPKHFLGT
jgi:hypothetical protein